MVEVASHIGPTDYAPHPSGATMKAAQWTGARSITLGTVPRPAVAAPRDAVVRVTHCTICGSDLHRGEPDAAMAHGDIMGHEAGPGVRTLRPAGRPRDHLIYRSSRAASARTAAAASTRCATAPTRARSRGPCTGTASPASSANSHLTGGYPGDQAGWSRVPNADLKAPRDVDARKPVGLADVTTTAWHGCELAEVREGDVVGVWGAGAGAAGLSVARLARELRGAEKVYVVDVRECEDGVAERVLELQPGGLDRAIEASGFRSAESPRHKAMRATGLERDSGDTPAAVIKATRNCGNVALIGGFVFETNQSPIGMLMEKTITLRGGQLMAQRYHPYLLNMVVEGKYDPSWMFTHEDDFENISECYAKFHEHKIPGGLKVLLTTEFGRSQGQ